MASCLQMILRNSTGLGGERDCRPSAAGAGAAGAGGPRVLRAGPAGPAAAAELRAGRGRQPGPRQQTQLQEQ